MKNKFRNYIAAIILAGVMTIGTAMAVEIPNTSNFSPQRDGIQYVEGMDGLSYPSFNNFIGNPNIEGSREGDERTFLTAKLCPGGSCANQTDEDFWNTLDNAQEGDKVRFEIYFHNNGEDPYDGGIKSSPNATNVVFGIQLDNITDPSYDYIVRPRGVISASNNEYRTNINDPLTVIKSNGNIVRSAIDDMQIKMAEYGLYLKPVADSGRLYINNFIEGINELPVQIPSSTNKTFNLTSNGNSFSIQAQSTYTDNRMNIYLSQLPGCFVYSGFVYFDAIVEKTPTPTNVCTSLQFINFMDPLSGEAAELTCTAEQKLAWFKLDVNFANSPEPTTQKIKFLSSDRKATISLPPYNDPDGELIPETGLVKEFKPSDFSTIDDSSSIIGLYNGTGLLSAIYLDENNVEQSDCVNLIIGCSNECSDICVAAPSKLEAGTYSELSAQTTDYYGDNWNKTITFTVKDPSYGKIYPQVDMNGDGNINELDLFMQVKADHPDDTFIEFNKNPNPTTPCALVSTTLAKNKVWFYSTKAGTDVLTVSSENNPNCTRKLSVAAPYVPICQNMQVEMTDLLTNKATNLACIDSTQKLRIDVETFTGTDGITYTKADHKLTVTWTTDEGNGGFQIDDPTIPRTEYDHRTVTTHNQAVVYTGIGPVTAKVIAVDDIPVENSPCVWTLPQCTECGDLNLTFADGTKTGYVGESKELRLSVIEAGTGQPYESTVLFKDSTGGKLTFPAGTSVTSLPDATTGIITYTSVYPYTAEQIFTTESTKAGTITAEVQGEESICSDYVTLLENICRIITVKAQLGETELTNPTELNGGEIYRLSSSATFASTTPDGTQINYNATNSTGIIFGYFAKETTVNIAGLDISVPDLDLSAWSPDLTVLQNEGVYFFVNPQLVPATYYDVIKVSVVGSQIPGCVRLIDLIVPAEIDCTSIVLNPAQENFDPTERTKITIDPNLSVFGDYDGDFIFTITSGTDGADLYMPDSETGGKSLRLSMAQATTTGVYIIASGSVTVQVYAADQSQADKGCKAVLTYNLLACDSISILTDTKWFDPADTKKILIEGSFGSYEGDFTFEIVQGNNAKLHRLTDPSVTGPKLTVPLSEALSGVGFEGIDETTIVRVYATGEDIETTLCKRELPYIKEDEVECRNLEIIDPKVNTSTWKWTLGSNDTEDFEVKVTPANQNWIIRWEASGGAASFDDKYTTTLTNELNNPKSGTKATITVEGYDEDDPTASYSCKRVITAKKRSSGSDREEPTFSKSVSKGDLDETHRWKTSLNLSGTEGSDQYVTYKLEFYSGDNYDINSVEITDESIERYGDKGRIEPEDQISELPNSGLTIDDEDDVKITIGNSRENDVEYCDYDKDDELKLSPKNCLEENSLEDFIKGGSLKFNNLEDDTEITILYEMKNESGLTAEVCKTLRASTGCGVEFINKGKAEAYTDKEVPSNKDPKWDDTDSTKVTVLCPYIITRSGGDAYFGSGLDTGTDIAYCGPQKNISGPIIVPLKSEEKLTSTGAPNTEKLPTLSSPTHDVCKFSNTEQNLDGYQNALKNFSSSICEMTTEVTDKWDAAAVMEQIKTNATRVGRFATQVGTGTAFNSTTHTQSNIYNFTGNATVNKETGFEISGTHTYIITGDLNINGNIKYKSDVDYTNLNDVPSAAFIVLGNIIIDAEVTQIDGIYITTGKFIASNIKDPSNLDSTKKLLVNGGLYGDVSNLFSHRLYVGDIDEDEGSVLIRYSENFLINTPPGLKDLMDITQLKTPY